MKKIKVWAVDFWPGFQFVHNIFYDVLVMCGYEPVMDQNDPDILFYSVFSTQHTNYSKPIKIFFSGENWGLPNFTQCNYALSGYYISDERHYRLPLYVLYCRNFLKANRYVTSYDQLSLPRQMDKIKPKTKFCNFVYSNCDVRRDGVNFRQNFFNRLSQYKKVDAGGSCSNNMGGKVEHKLEFMSDYKFTISMENSTNWNGVYGYTTEKIFEPMLVDSIPLYYGNINISTDFNTKSIVSYHDFNDLEKMIERIIEIDSNDKLYQEYLSESFVSDYKTSPLNIDNLITFFKTKILHG
jgi:hypothetical protein